MELAYHRLWNRRKPLCADGGRDRDPAGGTGFGGDGTHHPRLRGGGALLPVLRSPEGVRDLLAKRNDLRLCRRNGGADAQGTARRKQQN